MPYRQNNDTIDVDLSQPLNDTRTGSRPQPWREHRDQAQLLSVAYRLLGAEERARRVDNCAPRLFFTPPTDTDHMRLHTAWFCRVRICPVCQWRRSLKIYGQTMQVVKAAQDARPCAWVMLTLTVRNVDGEELSQTITHLHESWHRLIKTKSWKSAVLGWQRCTEVTHNVDPDSTSYNTYHPHFHALLCVRTSYFRGKNYLTHADWGKAWQAAARLDYDPMVEVHKVYGETAAAVAEVAKYSTKPADYLTPWDVDLMQEAVATLDSALARRRLVAWGGLLKTLHQQLGLDDIDEGDLVHTDIEQEAAENVDRLIGYQWMAGYRQYYRERMDTYAKKEKGTP